MHPKLWLLWSALLFPTSGFLQMPQSALPIADRNLPGNTSHVEIPFKLYRDYLIVVQGSLGTVRRLNFLVDTGVNPTAVDRRIAKKLGLTGGSHMLSLFNQNTDVAVAVLSGLQVGPILAASVPVVIQDLSQLEEATGVRIDAIIGLGVLSLSSFSIDYRSRKMVFGPIESSAFAVPFESGPPVLTVQAKVQDEPVRLLVDTGTTELVLFKCRIHTVLSPFPAGGRKGFLNATGHALQLTEVWVSGLHLGPTDFGTQKGLSAEDDVNCDRSFDGVIGVRRLGMKWVAFDFGRRSFSWKR
jgi:predicted aspartyl protease